MPLRETVRIEMLDATTVVGLSRTMSFSAITTPELWRSFMPRRQEIQNMASTDLYSIECYPNDSFFVDFNLDAPFEKWAAVKVMANDQLPDGMQALHLPNGSYAVFTYFGHQAEAQSAYTWIFTQWLPQSEYALDHRPHFALMSEHYDRNNPQSEEEIWIPIKKK